MGLNSFKKSIEETVVNPALAKQSGLKSGLIINAVYALSQSNETYNNGGMAMLDIIIYDSTGSNSQAINQVPMIKLPGIQPSLPPIGSTAIIAFLDGDESRPVCIGILTNEITNEFTKDHVSPRIPPKKMSK